MNELGSKMEPFLCHELFDDDDDEFEPLDITRVKCHWNQLIIDQPDHLQDLLKNKKEESHLHDMG